LKRLIFSLSILLFGLQAVSVRSFAAYAAVQDEIIVTASQFPADEIDTAYQTGHVTVLSSSEFAGDVATVADVLRKETGIQIRQSSGLGSYASVSVRGSTGAQVNIFLDGVRINDARGGHVDLSQFLLSGVDSIEIYRGNVPVQLGNAGIGGAINIKTKSALSDNANQLNLGLGSFGSEKASLTLSAGNDTSRYLGALEHLSSDNDYELINNKQTPNNAADDRIEKRQNAMFEHTSALLTTRHQLTGNMHLYSVLTYFDKHNGIPEISNSPANRSKLDIENSSLQLKLTQSLADATSLSYLVYGGLRQSRYDDTLNRIGLKTNLEETETRTVGLKTDLAQNYASHLINLSAHIRFEDFENHDLLRSTSQILEREEYSVAIQDEWLSDSGKWLLSGRLSHRSIRDVQNDSAQERVTRHYLDKHLGLRYQLTGTTSLSANIAEDIRVPDLLELFGDQGATTGNQDLKEEQAWNLDMGIKTHLLAFDIYTAVFYRQLTDAIVMIYDSRGIGQADNISKANLYGLELELSRRILPGWDLTLKSTLQHSEDRSQIPSSRGNPLPGLYEQQASIVNSWYIDRLNLQLEYAHRSGGNYDTAAVASLQTSNQYHFSMSYTFNIHRVEFQIMNLNDERIEDFNRYPGPGRRAFFTYAYTF
jgi:iron complex outermembrane receptor protein